MARDSDSDEDRADDVHESRECMACRGTGQVISNLGGSPSSVECPWCGGTGQRQAGRDAQARWGEPDASTSADAPEGAPEPADAADSSSEPADGAA